MRCSANSCKTVLQQVLVLLLLTITRQLSCTPTLGSRGDPAFGLVCFGLQRTHTQVICESRTMQDVDDQLVWAGTRSVNIRLSTGKVKHVVLPMPTPDATEDSGLHWLTQP